MKRVSGTFLRLLMISLCTPALISNPMNEISRILKEACHPLEIGWIFSTSNSGMAKRQMISMTPIMIPKITPFSFLLNGATL